MRIAITGGAGFVGSNLAVSLIKRDEITEVIALDNLYRRGSERNVNLLIANGVKFVYGDVRQKADIEQLGDIDVMVECSAEPSVLAGFEGSPRYLIDTNLAGAINCLEFCREVSSRFIFVSSSRVYPHQAISNIPTKQQKTRLEWDLSTYEAPGISSKGISEEFGLAGPRSMYGATKLSAELLCTEYADMYGLDCIVNRCGVIAGPGQFGKTDQGFVSYWIKQHLGNKDLVYVGFGGTGKQVRDILNISDLIELIWMQADASEHFSADVFNVGGGHGNSSSLCELTEIVSSLTETKLLIASDPQTRPADIPIYVTDTSRAERRFDWTPTYSVEDTVRQTIEWMKGIK